jgi:hypothetical protein
MNRGLCRLFIMYLPHPLDPSASPPVPLSSRRGGQGAGGKGGEVSKTGLPVGAEKIESTQTLFSAA